MIKINNLQIERVDFKIIPLRTFALVLGNCFH